MPHIPRAKKPPPKKVHFMAAASQQKHLKIYNFGKTNTILMKITTIKYHPNTFHLAENYGVNHRVYEGVTKKPLKKSQKISFWLLFFYFLRHKTELHMILCFSLHHWSKFQKNPTSFGGIIPIKPPRSSLKSTFMVLRKHLKIHNLATANAILMKLARIVYLHETFHLAKNLGVTLMA